MAEDLKPYIIEEFPTYCWVAPNFQSIGSLVDKIVQRAILRHEMEKQNERTL